jgi:phage/plasmid-associated DNA primase
MIEIKPPPAVVKKSSDDEIKIALIGCGGRGKGAVQQALETIAGRSPAGWE